MSRSLDGRVAFVTGASRGIGRAIARRLAAHGAKVVVTASARKPELLEETCALITKAGGTASAIICDLSDPEARTGLIAKASAPFGPVDILINNAAHQGAWKLPSEIDLKARRLAVEINLHAPIDLIQEALPAMRKAGYGRILNITSESAFQPPVPYSVEPKFIHCLTAYGASKAAQNRYTIGLAAELHGTNIHVNGLAPYKIAWSEQADKVARAALAKTPDWVEPLEMMAEAAYILVTAPLTGLVTTSRAVVQLTQSKLHALDGETVIGDALTLVTAD